MNTFWSVVAVTATVTLTSGCATASPDGPTFGSQRAETEERPMIRVANNHWADVIVYVENGSSRVRLGRVGTMQKAEFRPPRSFASNGQRINLVARPLGAQTGYNTGPISLNPGQDLQLNLENNLRISNWTRWFH